MVARIPADIDPHLVCVTGAIVTWWGRIENDLYLDLLTTRRHPTARQIADKKAIPSASGDRIKQWAKVRIAIFADCHEKLVQTEKLRDDLLSASRDRNEIVHAFWPYGNKLDPRKLSLQSMKPRGDSTHIIKEFEITPESLEELSERLNNLFHRLMVSTVAFAFENAHEPRHYKD